MEEKNERITCLRRAMKESNVTYVLIPTGDCHQSEYVSDYFKVREYFSHFHGSAGTLLIGMEDAFLWTDGRYFLQADKELKGTGITLMKAGIPGTPKLSEFLNERLRQNDHIGVDDSLISYGEFCKFPEKVRQSLVPFDAGAFWVNRPPLPCNPAFVLPKEIRGQEAADKCDLILNDLMEKEHCDATFVSKLDDIMWCTNLRGSDVDYNPVCLSYLFLSREKKILFIQKKALNPEVSRYLTENGILTADYEETESCLKELSYECLYVDTDYTSLKTMRLLQSVNARVAGKPGSCITDRKSCKSEQEIACSKKAYLLDSAVLTTFLCQCKTKTLPEGVIKDELGYARYLDELRSRIPGYLSLSFSTISAWGKNGAVIHYDPENDIPAKITTGDFYLVDSGGQYLGGTTDVTRTIAIGEVDDFRKHAYTLV